jgi:hypothetical protein
MGISYILYSIKLEIRFRIRLLCESIIKIARMKGFLAPVEVVFGEAYESGFLVYIEKQEVEKFAAINNSFYRFVDKGLTWGEFKNECPEVYQEIIQYLEDGGAYGFEDWISCESNKAEWPVESGSQQEREGMRLYRNTEIGERLPFSDEPFELRGSMIDVRQYWLVEGPQFNSWLSSEILHEFAELDNFTMRYKISAEHKKGVINALEKLGYTCEQNDKLIWEACGGGEIDPSKYSNPENTKERLPKTEKNEFEIQEKLKLEPGWYQLSWDNRHMIKPGAVIREYVKPSNSSDGIMYNEYKISSEIYRYRIPHGRSRGRTYEAVDLYEGKTVSTQGFFKNEIWINIDKEDENEIVPSENGD